MQNCGMGYPSSLYQIFSNSILQVCHETVWYWVHRLHAVPTGLPGVNGIAKDGRDGSPGDPGEPGEAGRVGRTGHQGPPGICDTSACQGAAAAGKSPNPKNH